jgi:hypothetical protein
MIPFSVTNYIEIGKISQALASADQNNFVANAGGSLTPNRSALIRLIRLRLEWLVANMGTDAQITSVGNYLDELCGQYKNDARNILSGNGSGGVIPSGGGTLVIKALYVQFTVGQNGALMEAGDTELIITFQSPSIVIVNTITVTLNNVPLPRNDSTTISYNLTTPNSTTLKITFNQAAEDTQLYVIQGLYQQSI